MFKNLILIGASSEIAQQVIYESRNKNLEIFKISKSISGDKTLHIEDYIQNSDKIIDFILELANVKEKTVSVEELYKTDDLDLKKEAAKAKKSNKSLQNDKTKKTVKKIK